MDTTFKVCLLLSIGCAILVVPRADGQEERPKESLVGSVTADEERLLLARERPQILGDFVRPNVQVLFKNLSPEVIAARREEAKAFDVVSAANPSRRWISHVVDPEMIPKDMAKNLQFLKGDSSSCDSTRLSWEKDDVHFEVRQTASIFTLKATPKAKSGTANGKLERLQFTKSICQKVFANSSTIYPEIEPVKIEGLKNILAVECFEKAEILELPGDKSVIGRPTQSQMRQYNLNEEEYWYRQFYWWNDGDSVGFFFPKRLGHSAVWIQPLKGDHDWNWFRKGPDAK